MAGFCPTLRSILLHKTRTSLCLAILLLLSWSLRSFVETAVAQGTGSQIVISQVYGGGGNSGATLKHDFVELFNRGNTPVSITGWSVQYASAAGTTWQKTDLSGSILPGGYYLVQQAAGTGGTTPLPTPDATGTIAMSATAAKVVLRNNNTLIASGTSCPSGDTIIDIVGYGSGTNCVEGSGPTATLGNTTAAIRNNGGCTDTNNNATDFSVGAPNPRNSASPLQPCVVATNPTGTGAASPTAVVAGSQVLLTVTVAPGANPASTGLSVTADLSAIGGAAAQQFYDDGLNGDAAAGDNIFSFHATVSIGTTAGPKTIPASITDAQARSGSTSIALTVQDFTVAPGSVVISQVYGGGGNSGALYRNDFIELYNKSASTINLSGWSVQYSSSSGTSWQKTNISGSIPAGGYYLIQQAAGSGGTVDLPTPDATGSIAMSATAGKVALVSDSTALSGSCPAGGSIIDFVGYGSANCFEGSGPTPTLSNTIAAFRKEYGCTETDNNSGDFFTGAPAPRNSASPSYVCGSTVPLTLAIHEIQGPGTASPYEGQSVKTASAVVTAVKSNGFFIQTPDGLGDTDSNTSEGIFVFTSSAPPASALVGNLVSVTGTIVEYIPSSDPYSPPLTEIGGSPSVQLLGSGATLPSPVLLTAADTDPLGWIEQLERLEGMRVRVDSLTVVAPTQGSYNEPNATATSNGIFFGVIAGIARPFREPGIEVPDPLPSGSPCCVPRFDGNPERLRVDSDGQVGAMAIEVTTGAVLSNVVGVLDYGSRSYTILPDVGAVPSVTGNISATAVAFPRADEVTIASINLERFFDSNDDPGGDPVLTPEAFGSRLNKASLAIRTILNSPDIIGVQEVENLATLRALAGKINLDEVGVGWPDPQYIAYLAEGNDVGLIDVGFLVKTSRATVLEVTQEGKDATYVNPLNGLPEILNDRPPLLLRATVQPPGDPGFDLTVIVNHLRSLIDIGNPSSGVRVRAKRSAQAEFLARLVDTRQKANPAERIVLVGDFNAYQFNDGYVDSIGTIRGTPTPAQFVVLGSADLVDDDLFNLLDVLPPDQQYSYVFGGSAQTLDHIILNEKALLRLSGFQYARNNADFPSSMRNDPLRPERISDHDMPIVGLSTDVTPPLSVVTIPEPVAPTGWYTSAVTVNIEAADNAGGAGVKQIEYALSGAAIGGGMISGNSTSFQLSAEGITTLKYRATDLALNVEPERSLTIKLDKTSPVVSCSAGVTVEATSTGGAVVTYPAATATDNLSTPTLAYDRPSGSLFSYGSTTVTVTATDEAGNQNSCSFVITVLGPRGILQNLLEEIVALRATVSDPQDGNKLDLAIGHLVAGMAAGLWLDDSHLNPEGGDRVFAEAKNAINPLKYLLKDKKSPLSDAVLQGFIDRILGALRQLVVVAIEESAAASGDPKDIAKARTELANADADVARGMYDSAVNHYSLAWRNALKAVKQL